MESVDFITTIKPVYMGHPYRWIIINNLTTNESESVVADEIKFSLRNVDILTDSNIILCSYITDTKYLLEQYYKIDKNSNIIKEKFGIWDQKNGFTDFRKTKVLSRRRINLNKKILTSSIVILNNDTSYHLDDYVDSHIDTITKLNYILVNYLLDIVNATKVFTFTNNWGYKNNKTNKWNGMIGDLLHNNVDIGGTALFITPDRVPIIEYISMTTVSKIAFVFRAPPLTSTSNIYGLPFSTLVWISCILLVIISSFGIYCFLKFEKSIATNDDGQEFSRPSDIILLVIGAVCQMGSNFNPKLTSIRIISIFLFVGLLFLYTSYTANIVSLLQSSTKSIKTLNDLLNSNIKMGVEDLIYNRHYFKVATSKVKRNIYTRKIAPSKTKENFFNLSYGIANIRKGLFAFHMELSPGYKLIEETFYEHEKCGLQEIDFLDVLYPWLAIQKNSTFKEILKINLFKIRENGMQNRELNKLYTKKPICVSHGQNFDSVRFNDCYAAYIILAFGYIFAILMFLFEKLSRYKKIHIKHSLCYN